MKSVKWFSISLIVLSFIFAGCFGDSDEEADPLLPGGNGDPGMVGFAAMTPGAWEELVYTNGDRDRYEFIGTDTYNGKECYILEFEMTHNGQKTVDQIWMDKVTGQGVVMFMKSEGQVMKMEMQQVPDIPSGSEDVPVGAVETGKTKYTTPTGKTVDCIIYTMSTPAGQSESWASSQVPFGSVKNMLNGQVTSQLYDFGSSGAVRDISKQEAENAQPFDIWGGGDIGGGDIGGGDVGGGDVGGGDVGDGDVGGGDDVQVGPIKITVGQGLRPQINVSKPINMLTISSIGFVWGFESENEQLLPGPFQYGVIPNGADFVGMKEAPDLIPGALYTIIVQAGDKDMGLMQLIR